MQAATGVKVGEDERRLHEGEGWEDEGVGVHNGEEESEEAEEEGAPEAETEEDETVEKDRRVLRKR